MKVYQYKITAVIDDTTTMIVNLFTAIDMDNFVERENYEMNLLDKGIVPEQIKFERVNTYSSGSPYFTAACEGIIYALEHQN